MKLEYLLNVVRESAFSVYVNDAENVYNDVCGKNEEQFNQLIEDYGNCTVVSVYPEVSFGDSILMNIQIQQ